MGNFKDKKDNVYLVKCPKCKLENYAINVSKGICTFCGFDANKDMKKNEFRELEKINSNSE